MKKLMLVLLTMLLFSAVTTSAFAETGKLVKVVDGDTLKLDVNGVVSNYRLAGIDTPESKNNSKARKDRCRCSVDLPVIISLGKAATEYVKSKYSPDDTVTYTVVGKGSYGRSVIWIDPLNKDLVRLGYASVVYYGNLTPAQLKDLTILEHTAHVNSLGIWESMSCGR